MRLPVELNLAAATALLVAAQAIEAQSVSGPAADFPVTIGDPYVIDGATFTPSAALNYDAVGHALVGSDGGEAISAAHHTLPVPSYAEVTSLETGRTILVRIDRRGPMAAKNVIELSPGAARQLGLADGRTDLAVRVRRVNPPEAERALLRTRQKAPARLDTPMSLVGVLKRKLEAQDGVLAPSVVSPPVIAPSPAPAPPEKPAATAPAAKPAISEAKPVSIEGRYTVQVAVFASKTNALAAAARLGTQAVAAGRFWRVRLGPFAQRSAAEAALAKAKAAGYSDARIQRAS